MRTAAPDVTPPHHRRCRCAWRGLPVLAAGAIGQVDLGCGDVRARYRRQWLIPALFVRKPLTGPGSLSGAADLCQRLLHGAVQSPLNLAPPSLASGQSITARGLEPRSP